MYEDSDQRANDANSTRGKASLGALQGSGLRHAQLLLPTHNKGDSRHESSQIWS